MEQERSDLHSDLEGSSLASENAIMFSCPYLGTMEDSHTSLSFPAAANHCFRTKTPATVEFSHQVAYCLTDKHPSCHVFQLTTEPAPEIVNYKQAAKPDRRNRRVSVYAMPLVLILILMAAILWWPAPGTSLEEAIAFGAQLGGDISDGFNVNDETKINEESDLLENSAPAIAVIEEQSSSDDSQTRTSPSLNSEMSVQTSSATAAQVTADSNKAAAASEDQPEPEQAIIAPEEEQTTETAAEPQVEETETAAETELPAEESAATTAEESSLPDLSEASSIFAPSNVSDDPAEAQETAAENIVEEIVALPDIEEAAASAAKDIEEAEEAEETPELIIYDLPVIDSQLPAQNSALEQPAATSIEGERLALIGPDSSSSLSLRALTNNSRALFVRQNPSIESDLLTIINRRQQAALLGRDNSGTWFKVRLDTGVVGWVSAVESRAGVDPSSLPIAGEPAIVTAPVPVSAVTAYPVIRSAVVGTGALNLRSGPGIEYEPITTIGQGELVGLIGRRGLGAWVRVRTSSGLEGWVNSSLLAPLT